MFLIKLTYKKPLSVIDQYLKAHRHYLETHYKQNHFIVSGPQNPRIGGILISQLTDRKQLDAILAQDPFSIQDLADYEVIEFTPVLFHPDFSSFITLGIH